MLLLVALLLCVVTVPLAGGRLVALTELRFRWRGLAVGALLTQIVIISILPGGHEGLHQAVHLATYGLLGWFVWLNRRIPGLLVIGLGGALNAIAIAANDGVMPATRSALRTAGIEQRPGEFANSTAVAHPHVQFLGDIFAIPASWPASNVFSVGDILIAIGVLIAVHRICGSALGRRLEAGRSLFKTRRGALG
jgi:Family of unknown function (DUF5317)